MKRFIWLLLLAAQFGYAQNAEKYGICEVDNPEDAGINFPIHPSIAPDTDQEKQANGWSTFTPYGGCPNSCDPGSAFDCCTITPCAPYQIPVVFTLLADNNCDNIGINTADLDDFVTKVNNYYACANIPIELTKCSFWDTDGQMQLADGSTRMICDDDLNKFYRSSDNDQPPNDPAGDMIDDFQEVKSFNIPSVMNIYIPGDYNGFTSAGGYISEGGVASFPNGNLSSYGTAFGILGLLNTGENCNMAVSGTSSTAIHEIGHWLGLYHTHGRVNNVQVAAGQANSHVECPDGSECCNGGDFICDTDPDPNLSTSSSIEDTGGNSITSCVVNNGGCDRDASGCFSVCGTPYPANINAEMNIMSYASGSCQFELTPCQISKMIDGLLCGRSDLACCDPNFADTSDPSPYITENIVTVCAGDPAPTFSIDMPGNLNTSCIGWYATSDNSSDFSPLGTGLTFSPPANTNIAGTYDYFFDDDLNNYSTTPCDDNVRKMVRVIVIEEPGNGSGNGMSSVVTACDASTNIDLDTDISSLGENCVIGWWMTEGTPINTNLSDNASLNTAVAGATIGLPISNPVNHLVESTGGNPLNDLSLPFDCGALDGNLTYYATPVIAKSAAETPNLNLDCTNNSDLCGSSSPVNFGCFQGTSGGGASTGLISGVPTSPPLPPTYTITIFNIVYPSNCTPGGLAADIRDSNFGFLTFSSVSGTSITFTETDFSGYDPANGFNIFLYDQATASCCDGGNAEVAFDYDITITYAGEPGIPFPSFNPYNDCMFGTPVELSCDCEDVMGCTNPCATNYNPDATIDDNSCTLPSADDGCDLTTDSIDPVTCEIVNVPPDTDDACNLTTDSFDAESCQIINAAPNVDDNCSLTADSFDVANCMIINTPQNVDDSCDFTTDAFDVANCIITNIPPNVDDGCDLTTDSFDTPNCMIINAPPDVDDACDLTMDVFDMATCTIINNPPDVDDGCPNTDDSFDAATCTILHISNCPDDTMLDTDCNCVSDGVMGCTAPCATNYNPDAEIDDGTCMLPSPDDGCAFTMDSLDPETCTISNIAPNVDDGCDLTTDSFDAANCLIVNMPPNPDDGCPNTNDSFDPATCQILNVSNCPVGTELDVVSCTCTPLGPTGCTNPNACNYVPSATVDDGMCIFSGDTCNDNDSSTVNDVIQEDCSCRGVDYGDGVPTVSEWGLIILALLLLNLGVLYIRQTEIRIEQS